MMVMKMKIRKIAAITIMMLRWMTMLMEMMIM